LAAVGGNGTTGRLRNAVPQTKVSQLTGNRRFFSKGKLLYFDKARTVISREDQASGRIAHAAGITNVVVASVRSQLRPWCCYTEQLVKLRYCSPDKLPKGNRK